MKSLYLFSGGKTGALAWNDLISSKQPKCFAISLLFELPDLPQKPSSLGLISLKVVIVYFFSQEKSKLLLITLLESNHWV